MKHCWLYIAKAKQKLGKIKYPLGEETIKWFVTFYKVIKEINKSVMIQIGQSDGKSKLQGDSYSII